MNKKKDHIVYKYTNKINGKIYIGQTCRTMEKRAGYQGHKYKGCPKFWNAIQKYGWDNFIPEVIAEGLSSSEASKMEVYCIKKYDSINCGYNILEDNIEFSDKYRDEMSRAVKSSPLNEERIQNLKEKMKGVRNPFYGKHHTEESKEKMRAAKVGKKLTEEHKRKISESNNRPFLGKHHTEESKEKMRAAKIGKKQTEEHKRKVREALKGRKVAEDVKKRISETHKRNGTYNAKKVICIETGVVYKNMSAASRSTGISRDRIRFSCNDPLRTTDGLHWKFYNFDNSKKL